MKKMLWLSVFGLLGCLEAVPENSGNNTVTNNNTTGSNNNPVNNVANNVVTDPCSVVDCAEGRFCISDGDAAHCVECSEDFPCATGTCKYGITPEGNSCVMGCNSNGDCPFPAASVCLEGACTGCNVTEDCAHLPGLNACIEGICSECATNADCADQICQAGSCVSGPIGTQGVCEACLSDASCAPNLVCVQVLSSGGFCFQLADSVGCTAPYVEQDIDGSGLVFCGPADLVNGCSLIQNFAKDCTMATQLEDCGPSGICQMAPQETGSKCTYLCKEDAECPINSACVTVPGASVETCDL